MKKAAILFLFFSFIVKSQNQAWLVTSSDISFKIKNAGFTVNGKFSGLAGSVFFDANKNAGNKIEVYLDANTINTGNTTRDSHLKKDEYFSIDKFPEIRMNASTFTREADGKFKGLFTLTLKGISKIIPVIFSYTEKDAKANFEGTFTINRLDYKIGSSSFILSDNVTIHINLACIKK